MKLVIDYFRELFTAACQGWIRFWFTPTDPATLGAIRILAGAMLFYTQAVWTLGVEDFFGAQAWIENSAWQFVPQTPGTWSLSFVSNAPAWLWTVHVVGLVACALLTVGLWSRAMAAVAWVIAVSYCHRSPLSTFGLDQINTMLALYLIVGDSGGGFSVDRWLSARRAGGALPIRESTSANVAIRLIQVHMCVIYFFAATSKLMGPNWWTGEALWGAFANQEYQTLDMTWLVNHIYLVNFMTHVTILWELSYSALIWPRLTRPLMLAIAVPLHLGIGLCMGMMTFGLVMLIANGAFVAPAIVRAVVDGVFGRRRAVALAPSQTATAMAPKGRRNQVRV